MPPKVKPLSPLYPLRFKEFFKEKPWGGCRLAKLLKKKVSSRARIGESWELSVRPGAVSVVSNGKLKGKPFDTLLHERSLELLGPELAGKYSNYFPLLIKFIDASDLLSVQVHPNDEVAMKLDGDHGKVEVWLVVDSLPCAKVFKGLSPGVNRSEFVSAIKENRIEQVLNSFAVAKGDVVFIPPGTVHTMEKGVLAYEVQSNSDLTYRVADRQRMFDAGKPRELHLEKAMATIDFDSFQPLKMKPDVISTRPFKRSLLVKCDKFTLERFEVVKEAKIELKGKFAVMTCLEGKGEVVPVKGGAKFATEPFGPGVTIFIPASLATCAFRTRSGATLAVTTV